ncbi:hypothetical protein, partial [Paenibacillus sp. sgz302251]|uniref:hypothetical protein n=1 Tax=Paenibacillus sp. sgz302251 TaxID=3414493 RepID=UPI003C798A5D
ERLNAVFALKGNVSLTGSRIFGIRLLKHEQSKKKAIRSLRKWAAFLHCSTRGESGESGKFGKIRGS